MTPTTALLARAAQEAPLAYGQGVDIPWVRIILALFFCLLVALAAIGLIRARNGMPAVPDELARRLRGENAPRNGGDNERIHIAQRVNVTSTSQIVVVKRGEVNYLLHLTNSGATQIDRYVDTPSGEGEQA